MKISCQICERQFSQITNSHLRSHSLTLREYITKFPSAPIVNSETSEKISKAASRPRSEEHQRKLTESIRRGFANGRQQVNKGVYGVVKATEETKALMREKRKGYKHSEETKAKISQANKGKQPSEEAKAKKLKSYMAHLEARGGVGFSKGYTHSEETKKRLSDIAKARTPEQKKRYGDALIAARTGWKASPEQRENYRNARIKYMIENPDNVKIIWRDTKPELEFEEELKKAGLEYQKQYHTSAPHFIYDFKVGDVLFEIDGPYHYSEAVHGCSEKYQRQVERDAVKTKKAEDIGMKLYRIQVVNSLPTNWKEILKAQGCTLFQ